ncbi:MAG: FtsW/RodA/SpoVE family cell cycle protein [Bacteroidales bacterium]|nr:FtsW/RodA/SpoVE family cell cycle protein [Bacteroidales bacterium]MBR2772647.1 FtsW/RodA/SpoVE family cell cycle protein [Bacteroidales bacterium]MBR6161207.1 FtsW/RodA/SpoVE family cell cycle protein [Bacteroidales bacterium]
MDAVTQDIGKAKFRFKGDLTILILVGLLSVISIIVVYSTGGNKVLHHLVHLVFCYAGLFVFYFLDYRKLVSNFAFFGMLLAAFLLIVTCLSKAVRGVTLFGHDVQTFYLIGLLVIIFLTNYIGRRYNSGQIELTSKQMNYCMAWLLVFCAGIAALNMSTAIILFATGIVIFYTGNFKLSRLAALMALVVVVVGLLALVVMHGADDGSSKIGRMGTFVNRLEYYFTKENENGYGDQMILARTAIARSGLSPAGPGKGVIKNRLPENDTDYAYASLFEETGLGVGILVLVIYMMIFYRSWKVSRETKNAMGALLSFGLGFWFTCQALVHIGVNCELLPATGQTLPFISSGGASLFVSGCAMGLLLSVSRKNLEDNAKADPRSMFIRRER